MRTKAILAAFIATALISIQAVPALLEGVLDLGILHNYEDQYIPEYVFLEETHTNPINDEVATLGRVLFYDKELSLNKKLACAGCHKQEFAFGDTLVASPGFDEVLTERRSTRLLNLNFNHMPEVFWDRRAGHLDSLPLMVLSNSIEMGFSGKDGQPPLDSLVTRLDDLNYYEELFELAYGDREVTAQRVNLALTEFVRSIVSYDSKYDIGRTMVDSSTLDFPNFTPEENLGKRLFMSPFGEELTEPMTTFQQGPQGPVGGGPNPDPPPIFREHPQFQSMVYGKMGCADCHGIDNFTTRKTSLTGNNGIIGVIGHPTEQDTSVKRSPSLRDLVNPSGIEIGPFMHDGSIGTLEEVMDHYATIGYPNEKVLKLHPNLDVNAFNGSYQGPATGPAGPVGGGGPWGGGSSIQQIIRTLPPRINEEDTKALIAFMKTLTGSAIYTDEKWSDPFDNNGRLAIATDCDKLHERTIEVEICEGDSYEGFYTTGIHKKRFRNVATCDSLIYINLTVTQLEEQYIEQTICDGDTLFGYETPGFYVDKVASGNGCDIIRFLELDLTKRVSSFRTHYMCMGSIFENHSDFGYHYDTLVSEITGCDSIDILRIWRLYTPPEKFFEMEICQGDSFLGKDEAGYYEETVSYENVCDTVMKFTLSILPSPDTRYSTTICDNENHEGYSESGVYSDVYTAASGCDSTRHITLEVMPTTRSYHTKEICAGEAYLGYWKTGQYENVYTNSQGCDSIRYLDLKVLDYSESYYSATLCSGETYFGYHTAGTHIDVLNNAAGCDSTRQIDIIILEESQSENEVAICAGEVYEGYSEAGLYEDSFQNSVGCDSTRVLLLEILNPSESHTERSICLGEELWGYDESGYYVDVLVNAAGCDSTRVLNLTLLAPSDSYEEVHLCPGEEFEGYEEGAHDELYVNAVGCDSVRYIDIINIPLEDAICSTDYDKKPKLMTETSYMTVGPNPVVDYINLTISKTERLPSEVRIYNSDHRMIYNQQVRNTDTRIDLTEFASGLYIIHVKDGNNMFLSKVLKM